MAHRLNKSSRIPTSKCYFHQDKIITCFCCDKQCTLPMCEICKPIHIHQHESPSTIKKNNHRNAQIVSYEEAYQKAYKQITIDLQNNAIQRQKYLDQIRSIKKECQEKMDGYFSKIEEQIKREYNFLSQLEDVMNKMGSGSIKTLILFYAGDLYQKTGITLPDAKIYSTNIQNLTSIFQQFQNNLRKWNFSDKNNQNHRNFGIKTEINYQSLAGGQSKQQGIQSHRKKSTHRYNYTDEYEAFNEKKYKESNENILKDHRPSINLNQENQRVQKHKYEYSKLIDLENREKNEPRVSEDIEKIRQKYLKGQSSMRDLDGILRDRNEEEKKLIFEPQIEKKRSFSSLEPQKVREHKKYDYKHEEISSKLTKFQPQYQNQPQFRSTIQKQIYQEDFEHRPLHPSDLQPYSYHPKHEPSYRNKRTVTEISGSSITQGVSLNKEVLSPEQIRLILQQRALQRNKNNASRKSGASYSVDKRIARFKTQTQNNKNGHIFKREQKKDYEKRYDNQQNQRWQAKDSFINQIYRNAEQCYY